MGGILRDLQEEKKGIRENLEEQYFEFYIAGYTKVCQGVKVQPNHLLLYSDAYELIKKPGVPMEDQYIFPFGDKNHMTSVELVAEPDNPYDKHALVVIATHPHNVVEFDSGENTVTQQLILGYVPARISRLVSHNLHKLRKGWIKKVRRIHNGKNCSTKVAIPWQPEPRKEDLQMMDRLADLVDFED